MEVFVSACCGSLDRPLFYFDIFTSSTLIDKTDDFRFLRSFFEPLRSNRIFSFQKLSLVDLRIQYHQKEGDEMILLELLIIKVVSDLDSCTFLSIQFSFCFSNLPLSYCKNRLRA